MKNADKPIYPLSKEQTDILSINEKSIVQETLNIGLTKREYFAGLAMQGILANHSLEVNTLKDEHKAEYAVIMADHLLKQLEK